MQASAVGYPLANEKRAMRQQYAQRTPNQFTLSGFFYPSSSNLHLNPNISVTPKPYSDTSDGFLSLQVGDSGSNNHSDFAMDIIGN